MTDSDDGLRFREVDCQEFSNARHSAGVVYGHDADDIYVRFEMDAGETIEETTILLRIDEAARLGAMLSNALCSLILEIWEGQCST